MSNIAALAAVLCLLSSCGNTLEGVFPLSEETRNYQIDTTITTIKFMDNHGISDAFYLDNAPGTTHHYLQEWGTKETTWGERYDITYTSSVNRFSFAFSLRATSDHSVFDATWNQKDRLTYHFGTNEIESAVQAAVSFYDTLTVRGIRYHHIIEIGIPHQPGETDPDTPLKTYLSGDKGLIKFERKDGVVVERVE